MNVPARMDFAQRNARPIAGSTAHIHTVVDEREAPREAPELRLDASAARQRLGWTPRWAINTRSSGAPWAGFNRYS